MKAYRATEVLVRENSWRRRKRLVARKAGGQKGTKGGENGWRQRLVARKAGGERGWRREGPGARTGGGGNGTRRERQGAREAGTTFDWKVMVGQRSGLRSGQKASILSNGCVLSLC